MSNAHQVSCSNCEWQGSSDDCDHISDIFERVEPGEIMPAGECPECGCLAHLKDEPPAKIWLGVFEGKNETVVRAFKTEAAKESWREELAAERWDDWYARRAADAGVSVATIAERADFLWGLNADCGEEFFTTEHVSVEG